MKSKHTLSIAAVAAAMAAVAGPVVGMEMFRPRERSENPWGPPSQKPEHLRDAEDNRKLQLARERRERKMKGKK